MNNFDNIDALITKFLNGEALPEEAISLEKWKESSLENLAYFNQMQATFRLVEKTSEEEIDEEKAWEKVNPKKINNKPRYKWTFGIAASFFVLCMAFYGIKEYNEPTVIASTTESKSIALSDGSLATIEKGSTLSFDRNFGSEDRKIKLSGKGEFTVTHDEKKPFIIETGGVFIEDLGTVFSVENYPTNDTVFVIVEEGIVRLYDEFGSEIVIKAGEKAWYIKSEKLIITGLETKVLKFDFKDTKLIDIVSMLDESFKDIIVLKPKSIGQCKMTTQFFDEDIETIISVISETLGFQYEYDNGTFIIKGQPCEQ